MKEGSEEERECVLESVQVNRALPYMKIEVERRNVSVISAVSVSMTIQCKKCGKQREVETKRDIVKNSTNLLGCEKCGTSMKVEYYPYLLTEENRKNVGSLVVRNGSVVCMNHIECVIVCSECSTKHSPKTVKCRDRTECVCGKCGSVMGVNVRSMEYEMGVNMNMNMKVSESKSKSVQDTGKSVSPLYSARQRGGELPGEGTCKHYKKSKRWFIFPCCNKAYACDICHNEQEAHKSEMSTRMICGHCSEEQGVGKECRACRGETVREK